MPGSRDSSRALIGNDNRGYIGSRVNQTELYIKGVTSNWLKRVREHKNNPVEGFTNQYGVHTLVWYERHNTMDLAIQREKAIKNWKRAWKLKVIEKMNSHWHECILIGYENRYFNLNSSSKNLDFGMRRNDGFEDTYPLIFPMSQILNV